MKTSQLIKAAIIAAAMGSAVVGLSAVTAMPAAADVAASKAVVDAAKAKGLVGEQNDGYLGFVKPSSDAGLKAAVEEINAGRKDVFAKAAAKNGVSIEAAGISAYNTAILPKVAAGEYYQDGSGAWVKK